MGRTSAKGSFSRIHVEIFRNERTWSTPLHHKLMFSCDSYYLGAFGSVSLPYESRYKTGWISAKVREWNRVGIFRTECTRSTPLDPKLMFWCVSYHWVHSGPFGCVTKIGAKWAELVRSCHEVASEFFATNTHDLPQWTINWHFGAFCTIWVHSGLFGCLTKLSTKRQN